MRHPQSLQRGPGGVPCDGLEDAGRAEQVGEGGGDGGEADADVAEWDAGGGLGDVIDDEEVSLEHASFDRAPQREDDGGVHEEHCSEGGSTRDVRSSGGWQGGAVEAASKAHGMVPTSAPLAFTEEEGEQGAARD